MSDRFDVLERYATLFEAPEPSFDGLLRRRDHRRRNQRITAGVVGIAVFLAAIFGLARATLTGSSSVPAVPDQSPNPSIQTEQLPPILGDSEVVVVGNDNTLGAFDRTTGERRTLVRCEDPCIYIYRHAVSMDGLWLAYEVSTCLGALPCEREAGIWVTNALGERTQLTQSCRPEACDAVTWAWSPVGATLAVGESGDAPGVFTIDPSSGERTPTANEGDVTALAWSPDGSRLAYAGSKIRVTDLASGRTTSLADGVGNVDTIAWSPDGTGLAVDSFSDDRDRIIVLAADGSGQRTLVDQGAPQGPSAPAWSPDGSRIAYVSTPQKEGATRAHFSFEVWVIGAEGSSPTRIFAGECCIGDWDGPVWSPDGERVAFFDDVDMSYGTWLVVNADGSGEPQQITDIEAKSWSRDGTPST